MQKSDAIHSPSQKNTFQIAGRRLTQLSRRNIHQKSTCWVSIWFSSETRLGPVLSRHVVSGRVTQLTLVLLAGTPVFGIDEEQRRLGVMVDDVAD